ncbi:shikimate 5-dehydrogenase 1 alpha [Streptomyces sp. L-9-10]|uniref:shikimate dehydrogenase n=1 Tax=Streptomyces sp. L-9-10 TaxID=1478131 RepID=UPI00101DA04E|nr:shikimate dehydrogenase [Streptomyces sp. L-9-10]RYJ28819.1 shikimate 5-dehydrogenase 1 alpha [Streptomyces sp. L-9-10]
MKRRLALLGSPVASALSPALHRAAYEAMGLNWDYQAIDCRPEDLHPFLTSLDESWAGFSLTMPLKRAVIPLLDEVSETVVRTGAANTITVQDGRLTGDNTDLHGMLQALRDTGVTGVSTLTVLGAGATACTTLAAAHHLGCRHATVIARNTGHATDHLTAPARRIGIGLDIRPWAEAASHLSAELVVSALPPHAADTLAPHWTPGTGGTLMDVTYRPWPSTLARTARAGGTTVVGGLPMLVHQAARQVTLQAGKPAPYKQMLHTAMASLRHENS